MSAAAVQQLVDILQAVSIGAVGTFLCYKFGGDAVWGNFYQPSSPYHKAICSFVPSK